MFAPHPVFYKHLLDGSQWGRAGTLDVFSVREDGLYAEAVLNETPAGQRCMELIVRGVAAWSTGTMPHIMRVDDAGYVSRWPLVEASVLHMNDAASHPGTTSVEHIREHVRSLFPSFVGERVRRSLWVMSDQVVGDGSAAPVAATSVAVAPVVAAPVATVDLSMVVAGLQRLNDRLDGLQYPLRSLPAGGAVVPQVQVSSKYDGVSLFGMLLHDRALRIAAVRDGRMHGRSEEFMRAAVDKMRGLHEKQTDDWLSVTRTPFRAVDSEAYVAWASKVPHLRANEAMQSTLAGSGDELVPTLMSSVAYYAFMMESRVLGLLPSFMMASDPFDYPVISSGLVMRRVLQSTDRAQGSLVTSPIPDSKPVTSKKTFTAGMIGGLVIASRVFFEDAGLSVADVLATEFARRMASEIDYVLLNGDERTAATNVSHSADPTGTNYDKVLILDGLRRIAQANSDSAATATIADNTGVTIAKLMGARGIIGRDQQNLALVVDPGTAYKLDELTNYTTVQNVGENVATLLRGQLGVLRGVPVIVADELEYTDASGLYPAAHNGTKGQQVLIHRGLNLIGRKREVTIEQGDVMHTGLYALSGTVRMDLQSMEAGSVGWGYNSTV